MAQHPSGFRRLLGERLVAWREGCAAIELGLDARHLNRDNVVHGGVHGTPIDAARGYADCYPTVPGRVRRASTVSLSTSFVGSTAAGRSIFFARVAVVDAAERAGLARKVARLSPLVGIKG